MAFKIVSVRKHVYYKVGVCFSCVNWIFFRAFQFSIRANLLLFFSFSVVLYISWIIVYRFQLLLVSVTKLFT